MFLKSFVLIALIGQCLGQDIILEGIAQSEWGTWRETEVCPPGTYVYGMRLKVHPDQGIFEDDTALNGVQLLCFAPGMKRNATQKQEFGVISSAMGHKGDIGPIMECDEPYFANGFQLRSEKPDVIGPLGDDTALNNFRLVCNDQSGTVLEGYGTQWGDWMLGLKCPRGLRICSIQARLEGPNGDDDTTLNNVNLGCCV